MLSSSTNALSRPILRTPNKLGNYAEMLKKPDRTRSHGRNSQNDARRMATCSSRKE